MKFTIGQDDFSRALRLAGQVIRAGSGTNVQSTLYFRTLEDGNLRMLAVGKEGHLQATLITLAVEGWPVPGAPFSLDWRMLSKMIGALSGEVTVEIEGGRATITGDGCGYELPAGEEAYDLPEHRGDKSEYLVAPEHLVKAMRFVLPRVCHDVSRKNICGAALEVSQFSDQAAIVAACGRTLGVVEVPVWERMGALNAPGGTGDCNIILPTWAVRLLAGLSTQAGDPNVKVVTSATEARLQFGRFEVGVYLREHGYPLWRKVMPSESHGSAVASVRELRAAVAAVSAIRVLKTQSVRLVPRPDVSKLTLKTDNGGGQNAWADVTGAVALEEVLGPDYFVSLNHEFLLSALKAMEAAGGKVAEVAFRGDMGGRNGLPRREVGGVTFVTNAGGFKYTTVLMPMVA
jgi:DNA polymerase III sliding clamp (beta) subunit (PCNA family)